LLIHNKHHFATKEEIIKSLVNNVKNGEFEEPIRVVEMTRHFRMGEEWFMAEVVKLCLSDTSSVEFPKLYKMVRELHKYASVCVALVEIWLELKVSGAGRWRLVGCIVFGTLESKNYHMLKYSFFQFIMILGIISFYRNSGGI
jgi:hypothetical protein